MQWFKKQMRSLYKRRPLPNGGRRAESPGVPGAGKWEQRFLEWLAGPPVEVQGLRMWLDWPDSLGLRRNPIYEPLETAVVSACMRPGMRVVDLGANIGYYTLLMARAVGEQGRVWAFEPDPANCALLRRNAMLNGFAQVEVIEAAAAEAAGEVTLYSSEQNRGDNRIYHSSGEKRSAARVKTVRVADCLPAGERLDFVKMDIQGAEPQALGGMMEVLHRSPEVLLLTEYWPEGIAQAGQVPEDFLDALRASGFGLHLLEGRDGKVLLEKVEAGALTRERTRGGVNLLASRRELPMQEVMMR